MRFKYGTILIILIQSAMDVTVRECLRMTTLEDFVLSLTEYRSFYGTYLYLTQRFLLFAWHSCLMKPTKCIEILIKSRFGLVNI